ISHEALGHHDRLPCHNTSVYQRRGELPFPIILPRCCRLHHQRREKSCSKSVHLLPHHQILSPRRDVPSGPAHGCNDHLLPQFERGFTFIRCSHSLYVFLQLCNTLWSNESSVFK